MVRLAKRSFPTPLKNGSGQAGVGIFDRLARLAPLRAHRTQFRNAEIGTFRLTCPVIRLIGHLEPRTRLASQFSGFRKQESFSRYIQYLHSLAFFLKVHRQTFMPSL